LGTFAYWKQWYSTPKLIEERLSFVMRIMNLFWLSIPVLIVAGCATATYPDHYATTRTSDVVVPAPTSTGTEVRVYPETRHSYESAPVTSAVPSDEWATGMRVRNLIAGDAYLKGASRNVDVEVIRGAAILRGTVISEYDREELAARIGQVPGVTVIDNRLVVSVP